MKLIIIRHGETEENIAMLWAGHIDGKLSENGKMQAKKLGERLKDEKIDFIYSSDLGRTRETVAEVFKHHACPVVYDELLRERGVGIYEGVPVEDFYKAAEEHGVKKPKFRPEGGENMQDVRRRVKKFIERIKKDHKDDETILICTSGGWLQAFMSFFFHIPIGKYLFQLWFENTSVSIFELGKEKNQAHLINCTKHL